MLALGLLAAGCGRTAAFIDYEDLDVFGADDPITDGCSKVDYLFVIDNSASMDIYQRRLVQNFPALINGVQRSQESLDSVHVGVLTTDGYLGNPQGCTMIGDLVTRTRGHNSSEATCGPFADGHNFMTENDDLETAFACTAQVGTQGSVREAPLLAIGSALQPHKLAAGACNAGFLRDDALLVIAIITDEDDPGLVEFAYERAVEAKHGYADNVVAVAIVVEPDGPCVEVGHSTEAHAITEFTNYFQHSFIGAICAEDYGPTFDDAVSVVQAACG